MGLSCRRQDNRNRPEGVSNMQSNGCNRSNATDGFEMAANTLVELGEKHGRSAAIKVLAKFNTCRLDGVEPSQYEALRADCAALMAMKQI